MRQIISKKDSLAKRVFFTLAIMILVRLMYFLPIPGADLGALIKIYEQHVSGHGGGIFDFIELLHTGRLRNMSLFALGIMPFINACVIVQIIGFLVPGVNRKFFGFENKRRNMLLATLAVSLILSAMHAYYISFDLLLLDKFPGISILYFKGAAFHISTVFSMSAAMMLLFVFAELINRFGVGNGAGVIFVSEAIMRAVFALDQVFLFFARNLIDAKQLLMFFAAAAVFIYFALFVTRFSKKIFLCSETEEDFFIPVRSGWTGIWPLIITETVISFFEIPVNLFSFVLVSAAVTFFTLLYTQIVYQPRRFYELILAHKCKIAQPNTKRIEDHLNSAVTHCVMINIILFVMVYYLPVLLPFMINVSFLSAGIFGAFGLIVIAGMYEDLCRQTSFFRRIKKLSFAQWELLEIVSDEPEAQIKKAYLKSQGVAAEFRPSQFEWGLPINTIASGYMMFVPCEQREKAAEITGKLRLLWQQREV